MAKISVYPEVTPPALDDYVIGTDVSSSDATKNFVVEDILALGVVYQSYVVSFSQSGTNAPVVTEIYNTIGNIVWTRTNTGIYRGTLAGAFPSLKTFFPNGQYALYVFGIGVRNIAMDIGCGGDCVNIYQDEGQEPIDGLDFQFEIRVYN